MLDMSTKPTGRPIGRPRVDEAYDIQINIRLTAEQRDWLDAESKRRGGCGRNSLLREMIDKARASTA